MRNKTIRKIVTMFAALGCALVVGSAAVGTDAAADTAGAGAEAGNLIPGKSIDYIPVNGVFSVQFFVNVTIPKN